MKTIQFFRVIRFATLTLAVCMMCNMLNAQNVGINATGAAPNASAGLDINFTNKGVLIPRVALTITTSNAPIGASVTTSLLVYNTATVNNVTPGYYYWGGAAWVRFFTGNPLVDNGLYYNTGANRVRLGGPLVENTTVTQGGFQMTWNLTGAGDFNVQDAGVTHFQVRDDGLTFFGDDTYWRDGSVLGTNIARLYDSGNDGVFQIYQDGVIQHTIHGIGTTVFNERGLNYDLRIESDLNANMFYVDASTNRVGIGTNIPTYQLDVVGNIGHNDFMYHNDDANTYFRFPALDQVRIYAGGVRMLDFVEGGTDYVVFNENSADVDIRMEGATNPNVFFLDGGANRIGIGSTATKGVLFGVGNFAPAVGNDGVLAAENSHAWGIAVNGGGQNQTMNGLGLGSAGAFTANTTATTHFFNTGGVGQGAYMQDAFGASWRIGHWTGLAYRKILGTGTVSTIVKDLNDEYVLMNCPEAPENLFMDFGHGKLTNGMAHIDIDPILSKNIIVNDKHPLKVFIQLEGECNGVYVTNKSAIGFDIIELGNGNANVEFSYSIIATHGDQTVTSPEGYSRTAKYDTRWEKAPGLYNTIRPIIPTDSK